VLALSSAVANAQANYLADLGAVAPALGVNNSGQVVLQNYIYSNGTLTAFPANFTGAAINLSGQVAGFDATNGDGCIPACGAAAIYANGTVTDIPGTSVTGPFHGQVPCYMPTGINDSGAVVGWTDGRCGVSQLSYPSGWLYSNGTVIDIGSFEHCLGVVPQAINDSGQITGRAASPAYCVRGPKNILFVISNMLVTVGVLWGVNRQSGGDKSR
jgi:probable HAF family extracellular repeat protein